MTIEVTKSTNDETVNVIIIGEDKKEKVFVINKSNPDFRNMILEFVAHEFEEIHTDYDAMPVGFSHIWGKPNRHIGLPIY